MPRPINLKCVECSKKSFEPFEEKPSCYKKDACEKKKCYYRKLAHYREKARDLHVYLRFRDDHCLLCDNKEGLEVHHIQAQSLGGTSDSENLITLCRSCHKVVTAYHRALRIRFVRVLC